MQRLCSRVFVLAAAIAGFAWVAPSASALASKGPARAAKTKPTATKASATARPSASRPSAAKGTRAGKIGLAKLPTAKLKMARALGKKVKGLDPRKIVGVELTPQRPDHGGDHYPVIYSGLQLKRADDSDGVDEPAVWVAFVRHLPSGYKKTVKRVPASSALTMRGKNSVSNAGAAELYRGMQAAILVSAVVEDDDGDSAARLDALDDLLDQAIVAADLLLEEGDDPLAMVAGMLELGRPMLGPKATRPDFRVVQISERAWDRMYDGEAKTAAAGGRGDARRSLSVDYKLATTHKVGKGKYRLLLDVPHDPGHKPRRFVRVEVDSLEVLTPRSELNVLQRQAVASARVCIDGACGTARPRDGKRAVVSRWVRQREAVDLEVSAALISSETTNTHRWSLALEGNGSTQTTLDTRLSPIRLSFDHQGTGDFNGRVRYRLRY